MPAMAKRGCDNEKTKPKRVDLKNFLYFFCYRGQGCIGDLADIQFVPKSYIKPEKIKKLDLLPKTYIIMCPLEVCFPALNRARNERNLKKNVFL